VIKSRRMRWAGTCSTYGWGERCIQGFGGKFEGKTTWKTRTEMGLGLA
jgi:hypothetical protein